MNIFDRFFALFGTSEEYEHFSFSSDGVTYKLIVAAIGLGLIIASAVMFVKKRVLGEFVRNLYKSGAVGAENSKKYAETGTKKSKFIERSLRNGSLSRMLGCAERDKYNESLKTAEENGKSVNGKDGKDKKGGKVGKGENREYGEKGEFREKISVLYVPSPEKDSFYLPEDRCKELLSLFSEKGSGVLSLILTVVFCVCAVAVLWAVIPMFLNFIDSSL